MKINYFLGLGLSLALLSCSTYESVFLSPYSKTIKSTIDFPFQVLHAEMVEDISSGWEITSRDFVERNMMINIKKNGHLILVHFSGKFLEFEGQNKLDIDSLNRSLVEELKLPARGINYRPDFTSLIDLKYATRFKGAVIHEPGPYAMNF